MLEAASSISRRYALSYVRTPQRRELDYVRQVAASADTAKEVKIFGLSPFRQRPSGGDKH